MDGVSEIFISPSSLGYLFAWIASWAISYSLYQRYRKNGAIMLKILAMSWLFLGTTMLFFAAPTFYYHDYPVILGWFNVAGNFSLIFWHAYIAMFIFSMNNWFKYANAAWWVIVVWGIIIATPLNILYMPMPFFDTHGIEIWQYPLPVFFAVNGVTQGLMLFLMISFYAKIKTSPKKTIPFFMGTGFGVGGIGASFITGGFESWHLIAGYLLMFFGGFFISLFSLMGRSDAKKLSEINVHYE